eukprot:63530_1
MRALKNKSNNLADILEGSIKSYNKRVMPRIEFGTDIIICDSIEGITTYLVGVAEFIQRLMHNNFCIPPFQVDLVIAVQDVTSRKTIYDDDDNDDDDDDD